MDLGLKDKVAIVSGGSSGIGEAVAKELTKEGSHVMIFSRNEQALELAKKRIEEETGQVIRFFKADVKNEDEVNKLVSEVTTSFNRIDLLVNAAGSGFPGEFESVSDEDWRMNFELNLLGTVHCSRAVLPYMRKQGGGSIINIAAISARQPCPGQIVSNATKAAVLNFSKTLAINYAKYNIRINCVNPGQVLTPRRRHRISHLAQEHGLTQEAIIKEQVEAIPLRRLGLSEEVAAAVLFLLSNKASFITGATLDVDGGEARHI